MDFSNPLIEMSIIELCTVWGELIEAYHNVNGNTAELYAYRFQRYSPLLHSRQGKLSHNLTQIKREIDQMAGNVLVAIVNEFCRQYNCYAEIDGLEPSLWCKEVNFNQRVFDDRAHVKIVQGK